MNWHNLNPFNRVVAMPKDKLIKINECFLQLVFKHNSIDPLVCCIQISNIKISNMFLRVCGFIILIDKYLYIFICEFSLEK